VARNRRRAAERKGRQRPSEQEGGNGAPDERLHREEQPGSLDHASGEVDEVEARIVAGAGGEPAPLADDDPIDDDDQIDDEDLEREAVGSGGDGGREGRVPATATSDVPAPGKGGPRFLNFLRASWAELKRVQWPDRRQVGQATAVVLGFVVVAGAYLGLVDVVTQELVDLII
jgi:preprotein translocase subunit SecE